MATNGNEHILNPISDESVISERMTLSESNLYTYGYDFNDGFDRNLFNWAFVGENFDPEEGGVCGTSTSYSIAAYAPGRRDIEFIATPKESNEGEKYSYDVVINVVYSALNNTVVGAIGSMKYELNLFEDGTLTLSYNHSSIEKK